MCFTGIMPFVLLELTIMILINTDNINSAVGVHINDDGSFFTGLQSYYGCHSTVTIILYSYTYKVPKQGTYNFVFANGQATGYSSEQEAQAWDYFNSNYRIGPNVAAEEYVVGTDNWKSTQMAGADKGAYSVKLAAGNVSIYFDKAQMQFKIESNGELGDDLYMVGGLTVDDSIHYYAPNDGVLMKYDNTIAKTGMAWAPAMAMPTPTRLTLSPKKATLQPTSR